MTDLRKAAEMALEALCSANPIGHALEDYEYHNKATEALRQAIEQAEYDKLTIKFGERAKEYLEGAKKSWEQEPVAWQLWVGADTPLDAPLGWTFYSTYDTLRSAETSARTINSYQQSPFAKIVPLYTAPPSKPWQSLTDEEIEGIAKRLFADKTYCSLHFAVAIQAKLKEKNT